jgi:hypothetical protein
VKCQWPDTQLTNCNRDAFRKRTRQCCGKTAAVVTHHRRPPVPIHPRSLTASQHESTGPRGCLVRTRQPSNGLKPWRVSQTMCGNSGEPFPGDMARSGKCKRMYCDGELVHFAELASCTNLNRIAFRLAAITRLGEKDWSHACAGMSGKTRRGAEISVHVAFCQKALSLRYFSRVTRFAVNSMSTVSLCTAAKIFDTCLSRFIVLSFRASRASPEANQSGAGCGACALGS